jgi:hypothetical protein
MLLGVEADPRLDRRIHPDELRDGPGVARDQDLTLAGKRFSGQRCRTSRIVTVFMVEVLHVSQFKEPFRERISTDRETWLESRTEARKQGA